MSTGVNTVQHEQGWELWNTDCSTSYVHTFCLSNLCMFVHRLSSSLCKKANKELLQTSVRGTPTFPMNLTQPSPRPWKVACGNWRPCSSTSIQSFLPWLKCWRNHLESRKQISQIILMSATKTCLIKSAPDLLQRMQCWSTSLQRVSLARNSHTSGLSCSEGIWSIVQKQCRHSLFNIYYLLLSSSESFLADCLHWAHRSEKHFNWSVGKG